MRKVDNEWLILPTPMELAETERQSAEAAEKLLEEYIRHFEKL